MKTFITKIIFVLSIGIFIQSKTFAQQNKSLPDFNQIEAGQTIEIQLFSADRNSIYFDSPTENAINADVVNGVLKIEVNKNIPSGSKKVKIYFKELKSLKLKDAAQASNTDTLIIPLFSVHAEGAAKINLKIKCDILEVMAEGASDISLAGSAASGNFNLSGANGFNANGLVAKKIIIHTEGISNAKINVSEYLTAHAEGASHIIFSGKPEYKNISVNGIATIKDKTNGDDFNNEIVRSANKDGDTTRLKIGKKKFMIIDDNKKDDDENVNANARRKMKRVWSGFEVGVNGFVTPQMNFTFNDNYKFLNTKIGESWSYGLNLFEWDGQIIRNKLAVTTGLGMQWNNIDFVGNNVLIPHVDSLAAAKSTNNLNLNKLYTFDLTAPLLIKFVPGTKKDAKGGFHVAAGVILHYITGASVVTETSANGYFQRVVLNDNFNINPFRVDATLRAGYSHVKFFANYSLTPYFNTSVAPDVRLFAAGITLIGF